MMAVGSKSQTVVEVLLNAGADINDVNINKWWYELTTMRFSIAGVPYFKRPSRKCEATSILRTCFQLFQKRYHIRLIACTSLKMYKDPFIQNYF